MPKKPLSHPTTVMNQENCRNQLTAWFRVVVIVSQTSKKSPSVSVVIVNFNGKDLLKNLFEDSFEYQLPEL